MMRYINLHYLSIYLSPPVYHVTLIGVFLGHFRINLHQTCTLYSNEGPQHWNAAQFQKKTLSKCGILSPKNSKTVVLTFLRCISSKFATVKNQ